MAVPKEVHDVTVSDGTRFRPGGGGELIRTVQYFVGAHGPFFAVQLSSEFSADVVQRHMEGTVKQLREVGGLQTS